MFQVFYVFSPNTQVGLEGVAVYLELYSNCFLVNQTLGFF